MNYDEWRHKYGAEAESEGWFLCECDQVGHEPIELQALADCAPDGNLATGYAWEVCPEFPNNDDQGAWKHVIRGALANNLCHQAALQVLAVEAADEFVFIISQTLLGVYS